MPLYADILRCVLYAESCQSFQEARGACNSICREEMQRIRSNKKAYEVFMWLIKDLAAKNKWLEVDSVD
ncbi:hypothetical protein EBT16_05605 [bacterium]|nr:hypothetical protein [bacterium]